MKKDSFNNPGQDLARKAAVGVEKSDPVEEFLRKKFNVDDVLKYEFHNLKDKNEFDYDFSNVRGSVQLMEGQIWTVKESEDLIKRVLKLDFSVPSKYKL